MKKRKNITEADRDRWNEQWLKQIENDRYEPAIKTPDVFSSGNKGHARGIKSGGRVHHFLSSNEKLFFCMLEYDSFVTQIQEQYALLPIVKTQAIAKELNIRHPRHVPGSVDKTLTTDFLVETITGEKIAFSIKPESQLADQRTLEKQLLEKAFWELEGIEWMVVTDTQIKTRVSRNLEILHRYGALSEPYQKIQKAWFPGFFAALLENPFIKVCDLIEQSAGFAGVDYLDAVNFFFNAVWHRKINLDLSQPLHLEYSAFDLKVKPGA